MSQFSSKSRAEQTNHNSAHTKSPQSSKVEDHRVSDLFQLQRTLGNRVVQRMISGLHGTSANGVIQRCENKEEVYDKCRKILKPFVDSIFGESEEKVDGDALEEEARKVVKEYNEQHSTDPVNFDEILENFISEIQSQTLEEEPKHEEIINEKLKNNDFRVTSGLQEYEGSFGKGFAEKLESLTEEQGWLDGGAGVAGAMQEYYNKKEGIARTVAVGFEKPDNEGLKSMEENKNFKYASGKFFGEMTDEDLGPAKFDLMTDFNGILTYTKEVSDDMQHFLGRLSVGGVLYAMLNKAGLVIEGKSILEWLQSIDGATVEDLGNDGYSITKVDEKVKVPALQNVEYKTEIAANSPTRKYTEK